MKYTIKVSSMMNKSDAKKNLLRWCLDSPKPGHEINEMIDSINVRGWVLAGQGARVLTRTAEGVLEYPLNQDRIDVIEKLMPGEIGSNSLRKCGFLFQLPLGMRSFDLGVRINGEDIWPLRIEVVEKRKVLEGKSGWLFLDNDTNRSVEQYKGELSLPEETISGWEGYLGFVRARAKDNCLRWSFLIVPNKEEVVPDFFPYERGAVTIIDQFLTALRGFDEIVYPLYELSTDRELTYYRVDSHWSDYGAYIAAMAVLDRFSLKIFGEYLKCNFHVKRVVGDLGGKMSPQRAAGRLIADFGGGSHTVFDNGIHNHGRIWIFEYESNPLEASLVIFGDSFSTNLVRLLNMVFRRIVYVHTVAAWDQDIVDVERPKYVLLQSSQRFITRVPDRTLGVWASVARKIGSMHEDARGGLKNRIYAQSHHNCEYYKSKMLQLIDR